MAGLQIPPEPLQIPPEPLQIPPEPKKDVKGENLYAAYGQTGAGRYLIVFFVLKNQTSALPISARDMTHAERKYYEKQKDN
jgi:uncharacterized DUF497 family protein